MWWSRRHLAAGLALLLAGCGFQPVHGPDGAGRALREATTISVPDTRTGFRLLARLEDRLGPPAAVLYHLDVVPEITEERSAVTADGTTTRRQVLGTARYRLSRGRSDGPVIAEGTVEAFTSYSATSTPVSTRAAAEDARDRLAVILADLILTRLLATPGLAGAATP